MIITELAYIVLTGLIQSYVKVIKWALINSFLVMTYENGTFYRIEESPEASPFELSKLNTTETKNQISENGHSRQVEPNHGISRQRE